MTIRPPAPYPAEFYLVHRWCDCKYSSGFGDIGDGPVESLADAVTCIIESFWDDWRRPDRTTVKVWLCNDDTPRRDVTEDVLAAVAARMEQENAA